MERKGCRRFLFRGERLHPLWRVLLYLVGVLVVQVTLILLLAIPLVLVYMAVRLLTGHPPMEVVDVQMSRQVFRAAFLGEGLLRLAVGLGLALVMGRFLDREPAETMGFSWARVGRDSVVGLALGVGTMLAVGATVLAVGWAKLGPGSGTVGGFLLDVLALLPAAAAEEIAFRGYLQRALTGWRGPVVGVVVSSALFALIHILNPNQNWLAMVNIALAGGVFALAVERTGTLWLAVGYHFAWNLAQGPLLGMPVSGMAWDGLLSLGTGGPPWLAGGAFGPEGGLLSTGVLLLSLLPLWAATRRPASLAAISRRQRARVEARFGPLPHLHQRLEVGSRFFDDMVGSLRRGDREGEVVLLLRRPDGSLLLHTKSFYPTGTYRLPSGGIRHGEAVIEAARREAGEETGLAIQRARPVGLLTYLLRHGRRRAFFHSWLVLGQAEGEPAPSDAGERIIAFRWVPPDGLPQVADALRTLPPEWAGWGRFRALAHDAAIQWLEQEIRESIRS